MSAIEVAPFIGRLVDVFVGPRAHYRGKLSWAVADRKIAVTGAGAGSGMSSTLARTPIPIENVWKILALD